MAKVDWFEMWRADKESMLATMVKNMSADLDVGYDFNGSCIQRQRSEIEKYEKDYQTLLNLISLMEPNKVQHFCYVQLLKSGAIA